MYNHSIKYTIPDQIIKVYVDKLKKKRDYIVNIFNCNKQDGRIYFFVKNIDYQKLLTQNNIDVMSGTAFLADNHVRICYSNS